MYSVLKTKRFHVNVPKFHQSDNRAQNYDQGDNEEQNQHRSIVGSCFLDDVFILFLFNDGNFMIVKGNSSSDMQQNNHKKKQTTSQCSIVYEGNVLRQLQKFHCQNKSKTRQEGIFNTPSRKLLQKSSLNVIEQSYSKIIFTDCKRIKLNQCIIITKHSKNVYWLEIMKQSVQKQEDLPKMIKVKVKQLPGTMLSQIISSDQNHLTSSMTILTQLMEFDNTVQSISQKVGFNENKKSDHPQFVKGSFCIKNQILEDKVIYITFYTRISEQLRQSYLKKSMQRQQEQHHSHLINHASFPSFIMTNFQFHIPINQNASNFIFEVSDTFNNEVCIYKQEEDDDRQWEILLYRFGLNDIKAQTLLSDFIRQIQKKNQENLSAQQNLAILNSKFIPKPITIILPNQFTSSIHIQQFIRLDNGLSSYQSNYLIVSINQTYVQVQQPQQPRQAIDQQNTYRLNGQLVYYNEQGNLYQPINPTSNNDCWIHSCKLKFDQKSENFTQWIQRLHHIQISSNSFLKIININYEFQLLYILSLAHQKINGQLYENKIDLISSKTGKTVEKGYCSIKNYSFSPHQKYILDIPSVFNTQQDFFYHIRLLFDKRSLYLSMIEKSKQYFQNLHNVHFIETLLSML